MQNVFYKRHLRQLCEFANERKTAFFKCVPALYTFVGVHFGSALSSKSGITLPVFKLLILLAIRQLCEFANERKTAFFKCVPALYTFVGVHFGSALSSKSGITLPVFKLLILLAAKTSSACFLLRENAIQLKSSSVIIVAANNSEQSCYQSNFTRKIGHSKISLQIRFNIFYRHSVPLQKTRFFV